jgi:hypothetical protein
MYDLFQLAEPLAPSREMMAEGAVLLRRAALPFEDRLLVALNENHRNSAIPAHDNSRRIYNVRRHDELRRRRMGHRSDGISL